MSTTTSYRLSGIALLVGSAFSIAYYLLQGAFLNGNDLATIISPMSMISSVLGFVGSVLVALFFLGRDSAPPEVKPQPVVTPETIINVASPVQGQGTAPVKDEFAPVSPGQPVPMDDFLPVVQQKQEAALSPKPSVSSSKPPLQAVKRVEQAPKKAPVKSSSSALTSGKKNSENKQLNISAAVPEKGLTDVVVETGDIPRPGYEKAGSEPTPELPFRVTEIFYADEKGASMAVVNDLPVMEGTLVDGAMLKEIHPDHIIFEIEGFQLNVPLIPAGN